jgi:hypothetical protein
MPDIEAVLREALRRVNEETKCDALEAVCAETNIFDAVDSMTIVDLLLESESLLEAETGEYVALAGESIFDAEHSPLRRWGDWVAYVGLRHGR